MVNILHLLVDEYGYLGTFALYEKIFSPPSEWKMQWYPIKVSEDLHGRKRGNVKYAIKYSGLIDRRQPPPCVKRPIVEFHGDVSPIPVLETLGCKFEYAYVRKGYRFRTQHMSIELYELFKLTQPGNPFSMERFLVDDDDDVVEELRSESYWILDIWNSGKELRSSAGDIEVRFVCFCSCFGIVVSFFFVTDGRYLTCASLGLLFFSNTRAFSSTSSHML